jgi:hypothetical protein
VHVQELPNDYISEAVKTAHVITGLTIKNKFVNSLLNLNLAVSDVQYATHFFSKTFNTTFEIVNLFHE